MEHNFPQLRSQKYYLPTWTLSESSDNIKTGFLILIFNFWHRTSYNLKYLAVYLFFHLTVSVKQMTPASICFSICALTHPLYWVWTAASELLSYPRQRQNTSDWEHWMEMMDRSSIPQSSSHTNYSFMQIFSLVSIHLMISLDHGQFFNVFNISKYNDTFLSKQFRNLSCRGLWQL